MSQLHVQSSSNGQLIAYKDHLKFACYDPSSGGAYDSRGNAPEREGFGPDGAGMPYSPFLELDEKELEYALILGDWWKAAKKIVDSKTILIGEESMMGSASKIHRLISEASPYAQPDGFFKATVEASLPSSIRSCYLLFLDSSRICSR